MDRTLRWGILGTGNIARQFAKGLQVTKNAALVAVGSRTDERAAAFAREFDIPRAHGSYEALAGDDGVDVVYVCTPHPMHAENALLCLEHGRHVLCEKPFTLNAREAKQVIETAASNKRFLMEGMWTRFIPATRQAYDWVNAGKIGAVRQIQANFGFRAGVEPTSRLFDPALGGGALLDVGVYTVSLASLFLVGMPESIHSSADLGATGVDEQAAMLLHYPGGAMALLSCAIRVNLQQDAYIIGEEGYICLHGPFWCSAAATLHVSGKEPERVELPLTGNGFNYEAASVGECIRQGALESSIMPLTETLEIMETLDSLRAQWGLRYPME